MIAKNSSAAVGAKLLIASMIESVTPPSSGSDPAPNCTAAIPKTTGTRINATTGVNRLLKIKYMKTAIMVNARPTSISAPLGNDGWAAVRGHDHTQRTQR